VDGYKQDAIAVRQFRALKEHQGPREKALGLSDVKAMLDMICMGWGK
jgi:hypothetical protein